MQPVVISSHILKLQGKAEMPREVAIGSNYHISMEGSITNFTEVDNEDGTHSRVYTFKPIKIDLLDPRGEALKLKDTRSKSQLFRARCWAIWKEQNVQAPFDQYYDQIMEAITRDAAMVLQMYGPN